MDFFKKLKKFTTCPGCGKETYKINNDTLERYCASCGFSSTRRGTENVDMD